MGSQRPGGGPPSLGARQEGGAAPRHPVVWWSIATNVCGRSSPPAPGESTGSVVGLYRGPLEVDDCSSSGRHSARRRHPPGVHSEAGCRVSSRPRALASNASHQRLKNRRASSARSAPARAHSWHVPRDFLERCAQPAAARVRISGAIKAAASHLPSLKCRPPAATRPAQREDLRPSWWPTSLLRRRRPVSGDKATPARLSHVTPAPPARPWDRSPPGRWIGVAWWLAIRRSIAQ